MNNNTHKHFKSVQVSMSPSNLKCFFPFSPQLHLNYQNESSYSLNVYSNDDGSSGYFSPSLQEDVFQQVQSVQDSMLLHGVDPNQLAESIQVGETFMMHYK